MPGVEDRRDGNGASLLVFWKEVHLGVVLNGERDHAGLVDVSRGVTGR
jgi:hypothetical protein